MGTMIDFVEHNCEQPWMVAATVARLWDIDPSKHRKCNTVQGWVDIAVKKTKYPEDYVVALIKNDIASVFGKCRPYPVPPLPPECVRRIKTPKINSKKYNQETAELYRKYESYGLLAFMEMVCGLPPSPEAVQLEQASQRMFRWVQVLGEYGENRTSDRVDTFFEMYRELLTFPRSALDDPAVLVRLTSLVDAITEDILPDIPRRTQPRYRYDLAPPWNENYLIRKLTPMLDAFITVS